MFYINKRDRLLSEYKFVDLFCGIGGFHIALSSFGAKCVFASEINEAACKVYENNFKIKPSGDIRKIKAKNVPHHDILCAGFPCQSFSISGKKEGFKGESGKLFFQILKIAKLHQPKIILLENVKNLVSHNNGKTIKIIEDRLQKIGYTTFYDILNATSFGVPQARKRVYIIAFRNDLNISKFIFPQKRGWNKCLEDILEPNVNDKYTITRDYEIDLSLINNNEKSKQLVRIGKIGKGRQGERIYSPRGQAITLSSQGGGLGGKTGMYYINNVVRKLTPRECARLNGFPDTFKLANSDSECYKQFGNSVVVNVLQEIINYTIKLMVEGE